MQKTVSPAIPIPGNRSHRIRSSVNAPLKNYMSFLNSSVSSAGLVSRGLPGRQASA